uniref:ubiquitinyl hydrolase 1 n=1 Tax=Macrostomum lignano TaxID=282301 RepID=A0A1I8FC90_9PLAT
FVESPSLLQLLLLHRQLPRSPPGKSPAAAAWQRHQAGEASAANGRPLQQADEGAEIVGGSGLLDCGQLDAPVPLLDRSAMVKPGLRLPPGWHVGNENGRYFYVDTQTCKMYWDLPRRCAGFAGETAPPKPATPAPPADPPAPLRHPDTGETPRLHQRPEAGGLAAKPGLSSASKRTAIKPPPPSAASAASAHPRHHRPPTPGPSSGVSSESSSAQAQVPPRVANGGGSSVAAVVRPFSSFDAHTLNRMAPEYGSVPHGLTGDVAEQFSVVVQALWAGRYACVSPYDFKHTIGRHAEAFAGNEQQDSQEFLLFLLDGLHEDLNRAHDLSATRSGPGPGTCLINESIMVELFQGQFKSTLVCEQCHYKSITFDAFMYLSLPVVSDTSCRLSDCLQAFLKPERLSGKQPLVLPRSVAIRAPRSTSGACAAISANPFQAASAAIEFEQGRGRKLTPWLTIHQQLGHVSLSQLRGQAKALLVYNLYGVSNHIRQHGVRPLHCVLSRNSNLNRWFKFDDENGYGDAQRRDSFAV